MGCCSPSSFPSSSLPSSTAPLQLILSPTAPGSPGEKGWSPHQIPSPIQPREGWMLAGRHPVPGRTEEPREPPSQGKHARGLREAHLHPLLCPEAPRSRSFPMVMPEERVLRHCSAPAGTKSHPWPASLWDGYQAQGNSGKPKDARTHHAHLFPLPFSPVGKQSSLLSTCSSQAWGVKPTVPPPCLDPGVLGGSWGPAAPRSPRLLFSSRAAQGRVNRGERGGRRGVGK